MYHASYYQQPNVGSNYREREDHVKELENELDYRMNQEKKLKVATELQLERLKCETERLDKENAKVKSHKDDLMELLDELELKLIQKDQELARKNSENEELRHRLEAMEREMRKKNEQIGHINEDLSGRTRREQYES